MSAVNFSCHFLLFKYQLQTCLVCIQSNMFKLYREMQ